MRTAFLVACCAAVGIAGASGCGEQPATPAVKPMPTPDTVAPLLVDKPLSPRIANYDIAVSYEANTHRLRATQTLTWTNASGSAVTTLPFHLYLNAFKNENSVLMRESRGEFRRAKATDTGWGWIEVNSIQLNGGDNVRADAVFAGSGARRGDETVLEVPLAEPLAPGAQIKVAMEFEAQLPEVFARTGYKGEFTMVGQWFPKIGVLIGERGAETWHCEAFHARSEFFADFGVYNVELTVPNTHVVAAGGVLAAAKDNGNGTRTLTYRAEDVHDFAWMIDPHMEFISGTAHTENGDVEVRVYARPQQRAFAKRHLQAGIGTIELLSQWLVPYPYARMSIISPPPRAASGAGGMEYPTIVTTAGDSALMPEGVRMPEFVTVHEVGHNWFQGIFASNEVDEPWLDEGTNEYIDGRVVDALYGKGNLIEYGRWHTGHFAMRQAMLGKHDAVPIRTKSYQFPDERSYGATVYGRTAMALRTLENAVGSERFAAALERYAQRYAFKHPTGDDFFGALEHALGEDISWLVKPAFSGRGSADMQVRSIKCRLKHEARGVFGNGDERKLVKDADAPDQDDFHLCDVLLVNYGTIQPATTVEIRFEDDSSERFAWPRDTPVLRLELDHAAPVEEVVIDPDNLVPLNIALTERYDRNGRSGGAARRAGAAAQFATQLFLQAVGL